MQHADTEYMGELEEELQTAVLEAIPVERRLRGLAARRGGLSPEVVLRRFTPDKSFATGVAGGLSDEQATRLRELLEHRAVSEGRPRS